MMVLLGNMSKETHLLCLEVRMRSFLKIEVEWVLYNMDYIVVSDASRFDHTTVTTIVALIISKSATVYFIHTLLKISYIRL